MPFRALENYPAEKHDQDFPQIRYHTMLATLQVEQLHFGVSLRNWDMPLCMYNDETNNIRGLSLSKRGLSVPDNQTFVIEGNLA